LSGGCNYYFIICIIKEGREEKGKKKRPKERGVARKKKIHT
jgi:hypothetical protein